MDESQIPIDIHVGKLPEWLLSRRIVDKNWHKDIRGIRDKISEAINDMPAHEGLVKLLSGAHINYFHCLQILDILKTTEASSKNVFGRYGSQRMKDWQEIIRLYEKNNLYIAEASQILVRNVNYEIPGTKKQIAKFEQLSEEAEKKIVDCTKSENILRNEYTALCTQLGIKGDNLREELIHKLGEFPNMLNAIAKLVPSVKKALSLYSSFSGNDVVLPLIRHIIALGNTTVYEFLYSEAPISVEEPPIEIDVKGENSAQNDVIDFGDEGAIDFGGENEINLEVGDIDWGGAIEVEGGNANEIDFNISLEESGIVVENDGISGGVAKGAEAYTVLDAPKYKEQFVNELLELESFLKMRLYEFSIADKIQMLSVSLLDNFETHDADSVRDMLSNVDVVISKIMDQAIVHYHQLKHSPKYVDILTSKLKQKVVTIDKNKSIQKLSKEKSAEMLEQAKGLRPTLVKIVDQTKILQNQIEKDISKRYKNRVVNLMGGVNAI